MSPPLCPTCDQPASQALGGPAYEWECRNEACPEFGQSVGDGARARIGVRGPADTPSTQPPQR